MTVDPLAEIRATFFSECEELLESLQDALAAMDAGLACDETVNTIFRAVHSIKGGAGAFGFEALVGFAHRLESVLDELRAGRIAVTPQMVKLLLQIADRLHDHIRAAAGFSAAPQNDDLALSLLEGMVGGPPASEEVAFAPIGLSLDFGASAAAGTDDEAEFAETEGMAGSRHWRVLFAPRAELYASGNEAQLILRELTALGDTRVICEIPDDLLLDEMLAEAPRLSWRIHLKGDIDREQIEDVFDFVSDVCFLEISEVPDDPSPLISAPQDLGSLARKLQAAPLILPNGPADEHRTPMPARSATAAPASAEALPPPPLLSLPNDGAPVTLRQAVTVRVDLAKIDRLANLLGELVISHSMLSQSVNQAGLATPEVNASLEAFTTLTRDLQDIVMSIRAQPVKPLFQRMTRIVREASLSTGKEVRLKTEGEATEVDKTLIERLAEPLTHLIRNAVDHGLEAAAARIAADKSAEGLITLSAFQRGGRILIEVSDDGAGIDRARVRTTAERKGLIAPDTVLADTEVDNLLFLPGLSTADSISSLSGRGVGMDVVKKAIDALGGRLAIHSEPGRGSVFSISLPLTLAVLDGMLVRAAGQIFVIPLSAIHETITPDQCVLNGASPQFLQVQDGLVPLLDLGAWLGLRPGGERSNSGIALLTVQSDSRRCAFLVDELIDQRQVVIKALGSASGNVPGITAATILGSGEIALILDPADLMRGTRANIFAVAG